MKQEINPIYIILLLIVVLIFVLFKLMYAKAELHEEQNNFHKTKEMVHHIVELQQNWDSPKRTKNALTRILKSSLLRNSGIIRKDKRGAVELHCSSINAKSASYLISRLLNEPFTLNTMTIKRLNKEEASFSVEIKL